MLGQTYWLTLCTQGATAFRSRGYGLAFTTSDVGHMYTPEKCQIHASPQDSVCRFCLNLLPPKCNSRYLLRTLYGVRSLKCTPSSIAPRRFRLILLEARVILHCGLREPWRYLNMSSALIPFSHSFTLATPTLQDTTDLSIIVYLRNWSFFSSLRNLSPTAGYVLILHILGSLVN